MTDPTSVVTTEAQTALVLAPESARSLALRELSQEDRRACQQFIAVHSKSFYLSSLLLPRARRHEAWALYAFCRQADDSVDGVNPGDGSVPMSAPTETAAMLAQVTMLRQRLQQVYAGKPGEGPAHAIDRAFFTVAARTGLPQAVPQQLLTGMEMDALDTRYATYEQLLGYCFNVAATVGLMMTYVMGYVVPDSRRTEVLLRACDLGVGMQLSNIARDVGEDARRDRVYLPDDLLTTHGLSREAVLQAGRSGAPPTQPLRAVVRELLARAEAHYQAAALGIPMLPPPARLAIRSAALIYSGIGSRLAAQGYDSLTRRAFVPTGAKLGLVLRAAMTNLLPRSRVVPQQPTHGPADAILLQHCRQVGVV